MKSTPTLAAASSMARASSTGSPLAPSVIMEIGVTAILLLAILMPISSPISSTVSTSRAATLLILSPARWATPAIESALQSRRLRPSVTVRTSRCSISVMATVCRISACEYSINEKVPGVRYQVPGFRCQVASFGYSKLEIRNCLNRHPAPGTRHLRNHLAQKQHHEKQNKQGGGDQHEP